MRKLQLAIGIILLTKGLCSNVTALGCEGNRCFWVVGPPVPFPAAAQLCASLNGSRLATIKDSKTNTFVWIKILPLVLQPWIGVNYIIFPWKWTDGTPYTGNTLQVGDSCRHCALVLLNTTNSVVKVSAANCHAVRRPFICSEKGITPTSSSITVHLTHETWNNARQRCRDTGLDLAVFPGNSLESVVAHIKTQTSLLEFWIGLYSRAWISTSTGQELTFVNIANAACHLEHGYTLGSSGLWTLLSFKYHHPVLCSLDGFVPSDPSDPTVNPTQGPQPKTTDKDTARQGFDVIQKVVIPVVCVVGGCVIMAVIACVLWRKAKTSRIGNEEMNRQNQMKTSNAKEQQEGYDNLASESCRGGPVYGGLDGEGHYYSEVIE